MNLQGRPVRLVQPREHEELVARLHSLESGSDGRLDEDDGIRCALATLPRRIRPIP
jgi:hypothetical protein